MRRNSCSCVERLFSTNNNFTPFPSFTRIGAAHPHVYGTCTKTREMLRVVNIVYDEMEIRNRWNRVEYYNPQSLPFFYWKIPKPWEFLKGPSQTGGHRRWAAKKSLKRAPKTLTSGTRFQTDTEADYVGF